MNGFAALTTLCIVLCAPVAARSATPSSAEDAGELQIYPMMTQVGTVASRTFRDSDGRVSRIIYYSASGSGAHSVAGPFAERDLKPQSMQQMHYDSAGRLWKTESFNSDHQLVSVRQIEYRADGQKSRSWQTDATGIRTSETRWDAAGRYTNLAFDPTGSRVVTMGGAFPGDIDLPHGWGEAAAGLACGITLSRERGKTADIDVFVNIRVFPPTTDAALTSLPDVQLRNADGKDVREVADPARHPNGYTGQEVGYLSPAYPLAERFPALPRGRYTLRLRLPVPDLNVTLLSNQVTFVIE
jgi:hypothetical protein